MDLAGYVVEAVLTEGRSIRGGSQRLTRLQEPDL